MVIFKKELIIIFSFQLFFATVILAQSNIKYGPDYIVFEAEDTDTPLGSNWKVRKLGDLGYLEYLFFPGSSPDPVNDTYFEFVGPWLGAGSELAYKFICPKTGTYQVAMRLHTPLRETTHTKHVLRVDPRDGIEKKWEPGDLRNDCFIKMEGNFTKGNSSVNPTQEDLETFHKFFGRGANRWGSNINLELHGRGNHGVTYNLIEGEEYTFYMKGRSTTAIVDYIAFYDISYVPHDIFNQSTDLALLLPEEIRPYVAPIGVSLDSNVSVIRVGTPLQFAQTVSPPNGNPSVTWSTSDSNILTVDENGLITAVGTVGQKAIITATSTIDNALVDTLEVEIVDFFPIEVSSISVEFTKSVIIEGNTATASAIVLPAEAENKNVTWSSSNTGIATIDNSGSITGVSVGNVIVRATSVGDNTIYGEAEIEIAPQLPKTLTLSKVTKIGFTNLDTNNKPNGEVSNVAFELTLSGFNPNTQFTVFNQLDNLDDTQIAGKSVTMFTNDYGIATTELVWSYWPTGTVDLKGGIVRWDASSNGVTASLEIPYTIGDEFLSVDTINKTSIDTKLYFDLTSNTIIAKEVSIESVEVYNLTGALVSDSKDLRGLGNGVYIARVLTSEGYATLKIVK